MTYLEIQQKCDRLEAENRALSEMRDVLVSRCQSFAESERMMLEEADKLNAIIWMIVDSCKDQTAFVYDKSKLVYRKKDCVIESAEDAANRRTVLKARIAK